MANELTTTDFQQLDRLDEEQILAEMQGAVLDTYVYSFKSGGRQVTGLSWAGVKAVAAKMGSVQVDLLQLTPGEGGWTCVVKATVPDGSSRIGAAEQPYEMDTKRGPRPDPFALPKCVSKAQRNAIRALLPESLITEVVRMYQAQQAPRRAQQPARKAPSKLQPTNDKTQAPEPAKWTHNASIVTAMFDKAREMFDLSQSDVMLALLVDDVRTFDGTKQEAWSAIEAYTARKEDVPL